MAPIVGIVLVLGLFVVPVGLDLIVKALIGSVMIILGLSLFLVGLDIGITPLGSRTGETLARSKKLWIVAVVSLILGFFISIAEPGLMVFSREVDWATTGQPSYMNMLFFVSIGFAMILVLGFLRIFTKIPFNKVIIVIYALIGAAAIFTPPEFLAFAFDASGATTGILAVPFILALGIGVSSRKRDRKAAEEDSFGLVAMASAGAIIGVFLLNLFMKMSGRETALVPDATISFDITDSILHSFSSILPEILLESFITLLPIFVIFIVFQMTTFKMDHRSFRRMLVGFVYSFVGLVLFFLGANGGFMDVAKMIGYKLTTLQSTAPIIIAGFFIGAVTMAAEPAVYVQTHQIEEVTSGYVKRMAVLIPLCVGVGVAVMLSVIRIVVPGIQLWYYLLPGYIIALVLSLFTPKLFVGIAFDAGGVATGPMTATFILSFTLGAAAGIEGANLLLDGFGMIALVAMFPIITLQILGLVFKAQAAKESEGK